MPDELKAIVPQGQGAPEEPTGEERVDDVSKEEFDGVSAKLETSQSELASSRDELKRMKEQVQQMQGRIDQVQENFLQGLSSREDASAPEAKPSGSGLSLDDLSPEERSIVAHLEQKLDRGMKALEERVSAREGVVRTEVISAAGLQARVAAVKRANPDTWDLVSPRAEALSRENPSLSPEEAYEKACEEFQPYLDAKGVVDEQREKDAKLAASEKPGGAGGEPALTPEQAFAKEYAKSGIEEEYK